MTTRTRDIPPIHPGEILKEEFLDPYHLSQYELGKRGVSADTALCLGRFFENAPEFWLNLQNHYDLTLAATEAGDEIDRAITVRVHEWATDHGRTGRTS